MSKDPIEYLDIVNDQDEVVGRASHPSHWSTPVGGHVQSGESYEQAAMREYQEELGTASDITMAFKDIYDDNRGLKKFLVTFKTIYNGPFKIDKNDVEDIKFFTLDQIKQLIKAGGKFHPELLFLLKKHYSIQIP
jgi:ADP-ribose pyrophosphatase YjhB (NUDIX family)